MFERLRDFWSDLAADTIPDRTFDDSDYRLAAASLLVHVAGVDGVVSLAERRRLKAILADRFGLDAADTDRLIAAAEQSDREAVDLFHFTSILKRTLDESGRQRIVEMLWEEAYADGALHEFEENVVWRVAELLGVSTRERVLLRQRVEARARAAPDPTDGPWAPRPAEG